VKRIRRRPHEHSRVASVELFFDLVFVFVVTQLSNRLVHDLTLGGAAKTGMLLLAAWWAWVYTTWTTNWFDAGTLVVRATLLVGMFAGMLGAISIPLAFGARAPLLVVGYVGIQFFRNLFIFLATDRSDPLYRPFQRILGWTCLVTPLWIAGALVEGTGRIVVWAVALVLDYAGPLLGHALPRLGRSQPSDWDLEPAHFVERLELFLIIALGETIVGAGTTASALQVTAPRLAALLVSTLMAAALWWLYFDFHAGRTLERLKAAEDERARIGRDLSYLYVVLVAGIIVAAVANELVIAHPARQLHGAQLVAIAAGPVIYLLGSVALKLRVLGAPWGPRLGAALLIAAAAATLGSALPGLALWALVLAILGGLVALEAAQTWQEGGEPALAAGASIDPEE
jgi:low temperature requirement protein LtrA